ncbi:hypothetical protein Cus16_1538 [Curtobacterium sp. ER1/6]|nr:hypothetical protein Cus16_1538 [Curtobacterium sp. ER1/6]
MTRLWSIGTRTAVGFAVSSMVLTAGVLVFVNLASQWSLSTVADEPAIELPWTGIASVAPDPDVGPAVGPDGQPGATVAFVRVVAAQQWQWSAVGIVAAGVLAGVLGWVLSRRVLRPIDRITATTDRISASTLHERVALDGPDDELRRLSATIDALLDRLEAAFASQRRFVAQAAHELRTPLAVQRASLQIGLPDDASPGEVASVRSELLEQNRRTEHLVESLLVLAEAERGLEDRGAPVDLDTIVRDVVAQARSQAEGVGVTIHTESASAPVGLTGEALLVRQLVANLVDNAVEYNHDGGTVLVRTAPCGVTVENTGPLVPPSDVATLTEPFRRGAQAGTKRHSGLGLSIVTAIADAHGWDVRIEPRPGGGLRVAVLVRPAVVSSV